MLTDGNLDNNNRDIEDGINHIQSNNETSKENEQNDKHPAVRELVNITLVGTR